MASAEPRLWAVIPAAGAGSRFAGDIPKQYLLLEGKTVLEHSAGALLALRDLQQLIIAVHPDDGRARLLPLLQDSRVCFVQGGAERADSVRLALDALAGKAAADDWVLVHDAARPCLRHAELLVLLEKLASDPVGGILAVPAIDTLKQVSGDAGVRTLDRSMIWQAQTPQLFRYGMLHSALRHARERGVTVTDEASAVEAEGMPVRVVEGSRSNIKITYPDDLALARFFLQQEGGSP